MKPEDKPTFAKMMAQFFAVYSEELTPRVLDAWWGILFECDLGEIRAAMNAHAADPDAGMFTPRPAHITNRMRHAKRLQTDALRALQDELHERLKPIIDAQYKVPNDLQLGLIDERTAQHRLDDLESQARNVRRMPQFRLLYEQRRLGNI